MLVSISSTALSRVVLWGPTHRFTPKLVLYAHLNHPVRADLDFLSHCKERLDWNGLDLDLQNENLENDDLYNLDS